MRKITLLCAALFTMVLSMSASQVQAQNVAWVGPNGSDTNSCDETSPCATFQGAINKGNIAEINCLGSGNYRPFMITGSITIDCGAGNVGNIVSSSSGINIVTTAAATIILRHLALNGLGGSTGSGIAATSFFSGTLIVEDCMIHGYHSGFGIIFEPNDGRGLLQVSNSQSFDNLQGISLFPGSGQIASVTLNKVELVGNSGSGLVLNGSVVAGTMRDSVVGETETRAYLRAQPKSFSQSKSRASSTIWLMAFRPTRVAQLSM